MIRRYKCNRLHDISSLYLLSPLLPKYDIEGNLAGTGKALILGNTGNPFTSRVNSLSNKCYSQSIVGSAYGEADIIKCLTLYNAGLPGLVVDWAARYADKYIQPYKTRPGHHRFRYE